MEGEIATCPSCGRYGGPDIAKLVGCTDEWHDQFAPLPKAAVQPEHGPYDSTRIIEGDAVGGHMEVRAYPLVDFAIYGEARPAGSKTAGAVYETKNGKKVPKMIKGKNGKMRVLTTTRDASKHIKSWKKEIHEAAAEAYDGPIVDCPLVVEFTFVKKRGSTHYRSGKSTSHLLTRAARLLPTTKPDVLKLARGIEDSLTGVVWKDDALIVDEVLRQRYGPEDRVDVRISFVEHNTIGDYEDAHAPQQELALA